MHTDHGKAFFSKPLQMPDSLDSRLRGNDGIGLPLQHGFFRFYVLDSRLRGNDGGAVSVFSDKFLKLKISSFLQKQKTKIRNLKFVIPAQAGIQCVEFQLFRINFETLIPSFPRKWESRISKASANL
ncbi:hypothetical protein I7Q31_09765 [Neisseria meningitidis]|nr:hypothetical protein [Neisseria meningitidis]MBH6233434.1 hypothetical protein [Neisseria meningitidis]MBH6733342.1 hypothetical protein [Neisseria meningitidis]